MKFSELNDVIKASAEKHKIAQSTSQTFPHQERLARQRAYKMQEQARQAQEQSMLRGHVRLRLNLNDEVKEILDQIEQIEARSRIQLGEKFWLLKRLVRAKQMDKNPITNKFWTWEEWASLYLNMSKNDIDWCISEVWDIDVLNQQWQDRAT